MAESILITDEKAVKIANELANIEQRKPHDSIKLLITIEGQEKIDRLKLEKGIQ